MAKMAKIKARISGNVVEFWEYESPIFLEGNNGGGRRKADEPKSEKSEEHKKSNSRKSKDKFMALVRTNFEDGDKFITLTFRDTEEFDIRNVEHTNREFKKFIQRLKYVYGNFPYIGVIEFQDENKRGAVHYHFIAKLGYVKAERLAEIWGLGYIGINRIEGVDNIGAYISKYMQKDMGDSRLEGKKNYLPSRGLKQPTVVYGKSARDLIESYEGIKKEAYKDCYDSEHFGKITYKEYNLNRETKQTKVGYNLKQELEEQAKRESMNNLVNADSKSLVEEVEQISEGLKNGQVSINGGVLEEIERREKKSIRLKRDWRKHAEKHLSEYNDGAGRKEKSGHDEFITLDGIEQLRFDWVAGEVDTRVRNMEKKVIKVARKVEKTVKVDGRSEWDKWVSKIQ